ncbi:MAG: amidohydrolase family protein [Arenicellaceae bacterium]|nr:amidohydrolase family protein [Arenicellaceae bacterium]
MATAQTIFKRIATEEAFVTQEIADEWDKIIATGAPGDPGFRMMGQTILKPSPGTKIIHKRLTDLGAGRIKDMEADGIDMQVISITSPGVQVLEGSLAHELAVHANDQLAAAVKKHPHRFAGLAAIAPQRAELAAIELDRAVSTLGLKGALINSHTNGKYLDDKIYWPILDAANALKVPIYLHPQTPSPSMVKPYLDYGLYFAGWGFAAETSLHALRLIMSGVFDQFPNLIIILGHMGEGIPFHLQRIDNRYLLQVKIGAVKKMQKLPSEYFKDNFVITTSGVVQQSSLQLSLEELGADRILYAADYPYESVTESVHFIDEAKISDNDKHKVYHGNAERLFSL